MGCGSSSSTEASAPGSHAPSKGGDKYNDDPEMDMDGRDRCRIDKKTGLPCAHLEGKDDDGREDDFFAVEEA
jgi:hypothetical protein